MDQIALYRQGKSDDMSLTPAVPNVDGMEFLNTASNKDAVAAMALSAACFGRKDGTTNLHTLQFRNASHCDRSTG